MPDFSKFACDHCGACCSLLVEATFVDAQREPRLYEVQKGRPMDREQFRRGEKCLMLYDTTRHCCPFLDADNKCEIYQTRPRECVAVEAGDAKCQQAREIKGLPMLCDRDGARPTESMLDESAEEYGLDFVPYFSGDGE